MFNAVVQGRVISVVKYLASGDVEVSPRVVTIEGGVNAIVSLISGQPISISGQTISISGQQMSISGQPINISGQQIFAMMSGQVANISGQFSGLPVLAQMSGQAVVISGQLIRALVSGQTMVLTSGNVQISGLVLISGRVDLATKIAGEDISGDVLKVAIASGYPVTISGNAVNISGQLSGLPVLSKISGQAVVISGQQIRTLMSGQSVNVSGQMSGIPVLARISGQAVVISGQQIRALTSGQTMMFQSGTENIRASGQAISINQAQSVSGLHGISGRPLLTNILDQNMQASYPPSLWRIQVAIGNTGQLTAVITNNGGISGYEQQTVALNDGTDLVSGSLYMFDVINQSGDQLNLQYNTSAPVKVLRIHEITAGTQ